jgi:hypothetical protein
MKTLKDEYDAARVALKAAKAAEKEACSAFFSEITKPENEGAKCSVIGAADLGRRP